MTQPTEQQTPRRELPIGTRVRFNTLTGIVTDPDDPVRGPRHRRYRPPYDGVWVYLDPEHHSLAGGSAVRHGMWAPVDSPDLTVLAEADSPAAWVGALVRLKGNPPEGHDRIGTVQRDTGSGWVVVAGHFTQGHGLAFPVSALERIQIMVLP